MLVWNRSANRFSAVTYPGDAAETRWIEQRGDGTLWIGTNRWDFKRSGIFVYDIKSEKFITHPLIALADNFFSVPFFMYGCFKDSTLWIGNSDEGIHVLDETQVKEVTPWSKDSMKAFIKNNNLINDMMIARNGRMWLGSYKGVYYYDDDKRKFISAEPEKIPAGVDDLAVNSLLEDHDGNVWAARWGSLTMTSRLEK